MRTPWLGFVGPVLIAFLALPTAHAQTGPVAGENWRIFSVPDFGTRLEYPAGIFSTSEGNPEKGVGERLSTEDRRASLSIYSRANEDADTPATYLRRYMRLSRSALQYQRVTGSFFAVSLAKEGKIYYSRCNFSHRTARAIHCFDLVYPAEEKRAWDNIVSRISLSLRPLHG